MTIRNYLSLVCICFLCYVAGELFDSRPGGEWFLWKAVLSAMVVYFSGFIPGILPIAVSALETSFIFITFLAAIGYYTSHFVTIYDHYVQILHIAVTIEIIILISGGVISGLLRLIPKRSNHHTNRAKSRGLWAILFSEDLS